LGLEGSTDAKVGTFLEKGKKGLVSPFGLQQLKERKSGKKEERGWGGGIGKKKKRQNDSSQETLGRYFKLPKKRQQCE